MTWVPVLIREADRGGRPCCGLGHAQLDRYLEFVSARARPNTTLATGYDLKVFFSVVAKDPSEVTTRCVGLHHRAARRPEGGAVDRRRVGVVAAWTIQRRLSSISGMCAFLAGVRGGRGEPGAARAVEPETIANGSGHATGSDAADVADDLGTS